MKKAGLLLLALILFVSFAAAADTLFPSLNSPATSAPESAPLPEKPVERWGLTNRQTVYLREQPGQLAESPVVFPDIGTYVYVLSLVSGDTSDWYRVRWNTYEGYIRAELIDLLSQEESDAYMPEDWSPEEMTGSTPSPSSGNGSLFPVLPSPTPSPVPTPTLEPTPTPVPTPTPEKASVCPKCEEGKCWQCQGNGTIRCGICRGSGICQTCHNRGPTYIPGYGGVGTGKYVECSACGGTGKCWRCNGDGVEKCPNPYCEDGKCGYCHGDYLNPP